MTNTPEPALLPVTQEDKDAAAEYLALIIPAMPLLADKVREGQSALSRAFARHRLASQPVAADVERDWWKPEPGDPYWLLELREGFEGAGAWLKNEHSCLTTRDAFKALRFPSKWHADNTRRTLHGPYHGMFEPTEHIDMEEAAIAAMSAGRERDDVR